MHLRQIMALAVVALSCGGPISKNTTWDNSTQPVINRRPGVAWTYKMPSPAATFLRAGDDQTLVLSHRGVIFSIDLLEGKRSSKLWQPLRSGISAYVLDEGGETLYFGSSGEGELWAYNPITGKKLWKGESDQINGPIVHRAPYLYSASLDGTVAIYIDSTGERIADKSFPGRFYRGILEAGDLLLALGDQGKLYAFQSHVPTFDPENGDELPAKLVSVWTTDLGVARTAQIVAHVSGIVVTDSKGELVIVDRETGDIRTRYQFDAPVYSLPTVADENIIIASADGKVTALSLVDASILWQSDGPGLVKQPLMLLGSADDETRPIIVPFERGHLIAYDVNTGQKIWQYDHPQTFTLVSLSNEGILVTDVKNRLTYLHPDVPSQIELIGPGAEQ